MPLQLSNATATKVPSIESLNSNVAKPYAIEVSITAANSTMIELQPTGSGGATSRADSSGSTLVADSSRANLDMMPVKLECHRQQVACVIRSSALGVNSGDAVYADAGSGGATSGDDSDGVVSAKALSGGATSGVDPGGAASANAGSGSQSVTLT